MPTPRPRTILPPPARRVPAETPTNGHPGKKIGGPGPGADPPPEDHRAGLEAAANKAWDDLDTVVEAPPPAPTAWRALLDKYGDRLRRAVEASRGPRPAAAIGGPPARDKKDYWRTLAQAVSFLQHDTPERAALLEAVGLPADAICPRAAYAMAEGYLQFTDEHQTEADHVEAWKETAVYDLDRKPRRPGLNTRRLSEVCERPVDWLWPQRVPLGYLTLVNGDPDLGKTWVILDILARVTTGRAFPDGAANPFGGRRDVLWVSAEDADEDVVKPRFRTLGGDPTRFHSLQFVYARETVKYKKSTERVFAERTLSLADHLTDLDHWLTAHPLVAVVALDPLAAFVGGIDTHRNSDVRGLLTPLTKLAAKHRVALVGNNHLHKGDGDNAMYRGMGSIAFVAAARSSWLVTKDPDEPKDRRLMTPVKGNLATEDVGGLAFRVGPAHGGLVWEGGRVETSADEALRATGGETRAPALAEAKEWLRELLKDGPVPAADVEAKAEADHMCQRTLKKAKKELGVESVKTGGTGAGWAWYLPSRPAK